jgi:hypothetical protein
MMQTLPDNLPGISACPMTRGWEPVRLGIRTVHAMAHASDCPAAVPGLPQGFSRVEPIDTSNDLEVHVGTARH